MTEPESPVRDEDDLGLRLQGVSVAYGDPCALEGLDPTRISPGSWSRTRSWYWPMSRSSASTPPERGN